MPRFVIWISELDSRLSRKYGREVPKEIAIRAPSFNEIRDASMTLGFRIVDEKPTKLNPRLSGLEEEYRGRGALVVESPYGKGKTLRLIATKIRELRRRSEGRKPKKKRR